MRDYNFGNFLHEARTSRGLTQFQLGALVGVSDKAVSKWENGLSKPQSGILGDIADVLGISVDELLACKYFSTEEKDAKGIFAMKKQIWSKALNALHERYGNPAPFEITSRFLTEQAEMQNTDMIVYLDFLAHLNSEAKRSGEYMHVNGCVGSSLISYLLGATDVDPLDPHYYCPACKRVEFDHSASEGWDLAGKRCSCGEKMIGEGHSIPFEPFLHVIRRNTRFNIATSTNFWTRCVPIAEKYFKGCKLTVEEKEKNSVVSASVLSGQSEGVFTFCAKAAFNRFRALERATGKNFYEVPFSSEAVLEGFECVNTEGVFNFDNNFIKKLLLGVAPVRFYDLMVITGLSHGTHTWTENGEILVKNGHSMREIIAYRDDVFTMIRNKLMARGISDVGLAFVVMEQAYWGRYAQKGMPKNIRCSLESIGVEDWLIESIGKMLYLFPKAQGATYVRLGATLMWYKINYPKEFKETML